jgi:hypothetical protein
LFVPALQPPLAARCWSKTQRAGHSAATPSALRNEYSDGTVHPDGFRQIESFHLDAGLPVWRYALAEALLEKRVWMVHGRNTVYITYTHARGSRPLDLDVLVMTTYRDAHTETRGDWEPIVVPTEAGAVVHAHATGTRLSPAAAVYGRPPRH